MLKSEKATGQFELVLLLLLGFFWGIPYALTKISLTTIPPLTMVAARVALAAFSLWIIVFALKCEWPQRSNIVLRLFIQGCLACVFPYMLLAFGQRSVDSALAAILNSTTPIFVCFFSLASSRRETFSFGQLLGLCIGGAGVVLIAGTGALHGLGQSAFGQVAIILATMASAASVLHGRWFVDIAPEVTAAGTLTAAAIVLVPLCFVFESPLQSEPSAVSVAALSVNAIVATALGFAIYFRLIRTIGSVGTASAGYLKLAVGVFIGCAFMGEALTWTASIGLLAILVGVSAINQKQAFRGPAWFATRFTARTSGITKRLTRTSVVLKNCRAEKVHII